MDPESKKKLLAELADMRSWYNERISDLWDEMCAKFAFEHGLTMKEVNRLEEEEL